MLERLAMGGWVVVIGGAFAVGMTLLISSISDIQRYIRMRRM
jgi:hypothetical protein